MSQSLESRISRSLKRHFLSPLRYPGGKRKLAARIGAAMDANGVTSVDRIIEPFAGGASVTIAFLEAGIADKAILSDLDPLVADFWKVVFSIDAPALVDRIYDAEVTIESWLEQRSSASTSTLDRAFKCLFLNRTSFSGVLSDTAGPIGGMSQNSKYKIDCRYNRNALAERVRELSLMSDRVKVQNTDFRKLIAAHSRAATRIGNSTLDFWYLDPPFFHKADNLYRMWFKSEDHIDLRQKIQSIPGLWFLSYDNCVEAREALRDLPGYALADMRYTANKKTMIDNIKFKEVTANNFSVYAPGMGQAYQAITRAGNK